MKGPEEKRPAGARATVVPDANQAGKRPRQPPGTSRAELEERVAAALGRCGCPTEGRYLVGVSGGRDSMVLLHMLLRAGYRRLVVCHLDHGLRGSDAAADARLVEASAKEAKLPVVIGRSDVRELAKARKLSLETAAREARKAFFFAVARARRCRTLFLAHHADDQVETVLFNLCRGTGATGLAGMLPDTEWRVAGERAKSAAPLRVVRPLLGLWRRELDSYAQTCGVLFREDATNTDPAHTRNRVRHELLPMLNDIFGREAATGIWRAADIVGAEEAWMRASLRAREEAAEADVLLRWRALVGEPVAVQRRVLRAWLAARGAAGIGYEEVERVRALFDAASEGPAKINLPGGLFVRRRAGVLFVEGTNPAAQRLRTRG